VRPDAESRSQTAGLDALRRHLSFNRLKYLSFFLSAVYLGLLILWLGNGPEDVKYVFGWVHGIGWIVSSTLCIIAARLRVIPLWLAVMVAVVGGVGPFAGSIGFIVHERRAAPAGTSA
jgi:hypothetical protein